MFGLPGLKKLEVLLKITFSTKGSCFFIRSSTGLTNTTPNLFPVVLPIISEFIKLPNLTNDAPIAIPITILSSIW